MSMQISSGVNVSPDCWLLINYGAFDICPHLRGAYLTAMISLQITDHTYTDVTITPLAVSCTSMQGNK